MLLESALWIGSHALDKIGVLVGPTHAITPWLLVLAPAVRAVDFELLHRLTAVLTIGGERRGASKLE